MTFAIRLDFSRTLIVLAIKDQMENTEIWNHQYTIIKNEKIRASQINWYNRTRKPWMLDFGILKQKSKLDIFLYQSYQWNRMYQKFYEMGCSWILVPLSPDAKNALTPIVVLNRRPRFSISFHPTHVEMWHCAFQIIFMIDFCDIFVTLED